MSLSATHTFAILEVSKRTFKEIKDKLTRAGYQHTFLKDDTIAMHGIGLVPNKRKDKNGH